MVPTAVSQLVEQIVRIIVLVGAFIVVNFLHESPRTAVSFAVFAAFIGALAGLLSSSNTGSPINLNWTICLRVALLRVIFHSKICTKKYLLIFCLSS